MKFCIAWESEIKSGEQEVLTCELNDDGVYIVEYPGSGRREVLRSLDYRFEILFEVGAYALLDCYYREAVSSFTAALERFYEFFVEVIARSSGVSVDDYARCWKHIKNASERQLGAFIVAYVLSRRTPPALLSEKWRAFRNSVIHKGAIPDKTNALGYGNEVARLIMPDMAYLLENHRKTTSAILADHLEAANIKVPSERELPVDRLSTFFVTRILAHRDPSALHGNWRLEDRLDLIKPMWLIAASRFYNAADRDLRERLTHSSTDRPASPPAR